MKLLESTSEIKKALGSALDAIREFSNFYDELLETDRLTSQLTEKYPSYCACCGHYFSEDDKEVHATHILALEEGGATSEDNMVLLCEGCYQLYESGRASIIEMYQAACNWRQDMFISLRSEMEKRDKYEFIPIFRPLEINVFASVYKELKRRNFVKALRAIEEIRKKGLSKSNNAVSIILEAQIERRRPVSGSLKRAQQLLQKLDENDLPKVRLPLYYYERGLICKMLGFHHESIKLFKKSAWIADQLDDEYACWESIIAKYRQYVAETIVLPREKVKADELKLRSDEFDELAEKAMKFDQPYAGRWVHNIMGWKWRYYLKCADYPKTLAVFKEWRNLRYEQNSTTGYTPDRVSHLSGYYAMMLLQGKPTKEEMQKALRSVCRTLMFQLSYRVRPIKLRDFLYTLETSLLYLHDHSSQNYERLIPRVRKIRESILDGSSFLDPYRAPNN